LEINLSIVTNQLSLNTKTSKSSLLTTIIVVDVEQMIAIEVSRYGVTLEMTDFDCMVIMPTNVKICIM
jgi:hypothetical protein